MISKALVLAGGYLTFRSLVSASRLPEYFNEPLDSLCKSKGFPLETYEVTTKDGYILTLHRIPGGKGYKPVMLVHGLTSSSLTYLVSKQALSPAFRLASSGFDVWLLNTRGSKFSLSHKYLSKNAPMFWDWTAYHMSKYDLPAGINFVLSQTKESSLNYIGHSQGGHVLLNLLAFDPEFNQKINLASLLAPLGGTITANTSFFKKTMSSSYQRFLDLRGKQFIWTGGSYNAKLAYDFPGLAIKSFRERFDANINKETNEFMPYYIYTLAGGTSVWNLKYFRQLYEQNKAMPQAFDYGKKSVNERVYGKEVAPVADYSNIATKIALFYGRFDKVLSPNDGRILFDQIRKEFVVFKDFDLNLDHGGFVLSKNQEHFDKIEKLMKE